MQGKDGQLGIATMRIDWGVVHKAEGSHFGWAAIGTDNSEETIAAYEYNYVLVLVLCGSGTMQEYGCVQWKGGGQVYRMQEC